MSTESLPTHSRPGAARLGILLATIEADRRITGVSAAGRAVRTFAGSGIAEIWIVAPSARPLAAATREDVARLAGSVPVAWLDESEALSRLADTDRSRVLVSATTHVLTADAVTGFASQVAALATSAGRPVLWRADASGGLEPPASAETTAIAALPVDSRAHWALVRTSGKSQDGLVSRLLNRRISRPISGLLLRLPRIRPGHATVLTAATALAMGVALFTGSQAGLIAGALLFQAASVIDGVDGEIARLTFRTSARGATLDSAIDVATNVLFLIGLTFNLAWQERPYALGLGLWSIGAVAVGLWLIGRRTVDSGRPLGFDLVKDNFDPNGVNWFKLLIVRAAFAISSRDGFAFLFAVLIASGLEMVSLILFAGLAAIWITVVLINTVFAAPVGPADQPASVRFVDV